MQPHMQAVSRCQVHAKTKRWQYKRKGWPMRSLKKTEIVEIGEKRPNNNKNNGAAQWGVVWTDDKVKLLQNITLE